MYIFLTFLLIIATIHAIRACYRVKPDHRAVVNRLGKFTKIVGEGWHMKAPMIDHVEIIDLNKSLPGWKGYSSSELDEKLKDLSSLNHPGIYKKVSS